MNQGRTVLAQILDGLEAKEVTRCAARYPMPRDTPVLSAYEHFAVMVFAQLTYRESLRDIEAAVANAKGKTRWWEYNIAEPFIKMLPTNIAAGIGLAQLNRIDSLQAKRAEIWQRYQKEFSALGWVTILAEATAGDKHSYFTYCVRMPKRDELAHFLLDNQVYTTLRYHPLHLNALYRQTDVRLPHCEALNEDALSIPLHPRLTNDEVDKIVDLFRKFGKTHSL